jgi:predicted house-cleaning noncanonical NTP pyrophosphatase (MazG superfamily)
MRYDKLVRDKIPEIIERKGEKALFHIADEAEYRSQLERKLKEETAEFLKDKNAEELADILEVVYALAATLNVSLEELERLRLKKAQERGDFKKRIILEETL